jgi:hypothetical protein
MSGTASVLSSDMGTMPLHRHLRDKLYLPTSLWVTYAVTYFLAGILMNQVGQWLAIARFTYWWQVITVYVLYMVPLSVIFRRLPWWQQYLYGLFPMGLLEFGGYALHTSYAYPHNLLDRLFSERNFTLAMVLFFSAYFPLLNALVSTLHSRLFQPRARGAATAGLELVPAQQPPYQ